MAKRDVPVSPEVIDCQDRKWLRPRRFITRSRSVPGTGPVTSPLVEADRRWWCIEVSDNDGGDILIVLKDFEESI